MVSAKRAAASTPTSSLLDLLPGCFVSDRAALVNMDLALFLGRPSSTQPFDFFDKHIMLGLWRSSSTAGPQGSNFTLGLGQPEADQ